MNYDEYFAQGVALQEAGHWLEAATIYGELAQVLTQVPGLHWNLGTVNKQMGRWSAALAAFEKAVALDPSQRGADFNIGLCLLNLGRTAEAVPHLQRAGEAEPDEFATHFNLARAHIALGQGAEAASRVAIACALRPDHIDAARLRSRLRAQQTTAGLPPLWRDRRRVDALAAAIAATVTPGDIVLDLATNGGLSALLALRAGAERVYSWCADITMAQSVAAVGEANGLAGRLVVMTGPLAALTVAEPGEAGGTGGIALATPASVLILDLPAAQPLAPGILPLLRDARARLLTPDARVLPRRLRVKVMLAGGPDLEDLSMPATLAGYDLGPLDAVQPVGIPLPPCHPIPLSPAMTVLDLDTASPPTALVRQETTPLTADRDGRLAGLVSWQDIVWGEGLGWDNAPGHPAALPPLFHRCRHPVDVLAGEEVSVRLYQDEQDLWLAPLR